MMTNGTPLNFWCMEGAGNKILVLDLRRGTNKLDQIDVNKLASATHYAFDQVMCLCRPRVPEHTVRVHILNRDGSSAEACGNGMRCVAKTMFDMQDTPDTTITIETSLGAFKAYHNPESGISVQMGKAEFNWTSIPLAIAYPEPIVSELVSRYPQLEFVEQIAFASMGNPHMMILHKPDSKTDYDDGFALELERDRAFPNGMNISFAKICSPSILEVWVWERGTGRTMACGSAACALSAMMHHYKGWTFPISVKMPGGILRVNSEPDKTLVLSGDVQLCFRGVLEPTEQ